MDSSKNIDRKNAAAEVVVDEICCQCPPGENRCQSEDSGCPCFRTGKSCQFRCQSGRFRGDCLNRPVTKCSCLPHFNPSIGIATAISTDAASPIGVPGGPRSFCGSSQCECYRYREPCSVYCGCQGRACQHTQATSTLYTEKKKTDREETVSAKGCKCKGTGDKGCVKSKCECRQALLPCLSNCKCLGDCPNSLRPPLTKQIREAFMRPTQDHSGLIAILSGKDYIYRMEFLDSEPLFPATHALESFYEAVMNVVSKQTVELSHIQLYITRSPCFHQDCDPECSVLEHCETQKSCSRLLSVAFGQIKKHLGKCDLQMSLKFLLPYMKRGDLYTQQGLINMLENGIIVEPLCMKEWVDLLQTADETDPAAFSKENLMGHWVETGMESYLKQSQYYVNSCRKNLGLKATYWTSGFHQLLKTTAVTCSAAQYHFQSIARRLAQQVEIESTFKELKSCRGPTAKGSLDNLLLYSTPPPDSSVCCSTGGNNNNNNSLIDSFYDGTLPRGHTLASLGSNQHGGLVDDDSMTTTTASNKGSSVSTKENTPKKGKKSHKEKGGGKEAPPRSRTGTGFASILSPKKQSSSKDEPTNTVDSNNKTQLEHVLEYQPAPQNAQLNNNTGAASVAMDYYYAVNDETIPVIDADDGVAVCPSAVMSTTDGLRDPIGPSATAATSSANSKIWMRNPPTSKELQKIVLNFSGRNTSELERSEIREDVIQAIAGIQDQIGSLLLYLDQKSSATPV